MDWPKLKRDLKGMRVRVVKPFGNKSIHLHEGATATIVGWYRGANLKADPCPACNVGVYITRVPLSFLEPLGEETPATPSGDVWISVADRLPDVKIELAGGVQGGWSENVLVHRRNGVIGIDCYHRRKSPKYEYVGRWWDDLPPVTHWCPLPEPPKT